MRRKGTLWTIIGMMILGVAVLLYPILSSAVNRINGSYVIHELQMQLEQMDSEQLVAELQAAQQYNEQLHDSTDATMDYDEILNFGNGVMGYLTVEKIDLMLPIYHGVTNEVLEKGIGHLPESAFPIGGSGNHAVLTGHTGLPSAELFTNLEKLEMGDQFQIRVGSSTVFYAIDQILVVLPSQTDALMPIQGEDYCTLVTCTPYGINTHRLLVRGMRTIPTEVVENSNMQEKILAKDRRGLAWILLLPCAGIILIAKRKRGRYA